MKKDRYVYPAKFQDSEDGISIEFPDFPGCFSCATDYEEAMNCAKDAMALHIYGMEKDGEEIPKASNLSKIIMDDPDCTVALIEVWMPPFRDEMVNKAVKKTLTIPQWLDELAIENKVNFSRVLQEALKDYLGVNKK